jgi:hypothetical protein
MLRKIEVDWRRREWLVSPRRSNLVSTRFIFVPGHAGVRGNERADRLAGKAVISDGRAMDHDDVLHALRGAGKVEDSLGDRVEYYGKIEGWSGQAWCGQI